jgi:hypothetical protein
MGSLFSPKGMFDDDRFFTDYVQLFIVPKPATILQHKYCRRSRAWHR